MPLLKANETRAAIAAAATVFPEWKRRTAKERADVLKRWRDLILAHAQDLAVIMTSECGKPLAEARAEVASGYAASSSLLLSVDASHACQEIHEAEHIVFDQTKSAEEER